MILEVNLCSSMTSCPLFEPVVLKILYVISFRLQGSCIPHVNVGLLDWDIVKYAINTPVRCRSVFYVSLLTLSDSVASPMLS